MESIVKRQRVFFNTNETKDIDFRKLQLKKLKKLLKENQDLLNKAIFDDFGKSYFDNYISELSLLYHDIDEAIKKVKKWAKVKKVRTNLLNQPAKSYIIPEPLGVCLVIGAWNYPYLLSIAPAIAAIAAGNTVILKPSELPMRTSNAMAKLINENFDPEIFKVIEGGTILVATLAFCTEGQLFFLGLCKRPESTALPNVSRLIPN